MCNNVVRVTSNSKATCTVAVLHNDNIFLHRHIVHGILFLVHKLIK